MVSVFTQYDCDLFYERKFVDSVELGFAFSLISFSSQFDAVVYCVLEVYETVQHDDIRNSKMKIRVVLTYGRNK